MAVEETEGHRDDKGRIGTEDRRGGRGPWIKGRRGNKGPRGSNRGQRP